MVVMSSDVSCVWRSFEHPQQQLGSTQGWMQQKCGTQPAEMDTFLRMPFHGSGRTAVKAPTNGGSTERRQPQQAPPNIMRGGGQGEAGSLFDEGCARSERGTCPRGRGGECIVDRLPLLCERRAHIMHAQATQQTLARTHTDARVRDAGEAEARVVAREGRCRVGNRRAGT